jgi:hypothetical protein
MARRENAWLRVRIPRSPPHSLRVGESPARPPAETPQSPQNAGFLHFRVSVEWTVETLFEDDYLVFLQPRFRQSLVGVLGEAEVRLLGAPFEWKVLFQALQR